MEFKVSERYPISILVLAQGRSRVNTALSSSPSYFNSRPRVRAVIRARGANVAPAHFNSRPRVRAVLKLSQKRVVGLFISILALA